VKLKKGDLIKFKHDVFAYSPYNHTSRLRGTKNKIALVLGKYKPNETYSGFVCYINKEHIVVFSNPNWFNVIKIV